MSLAKRLRGWVRVLRGHPEEPGQDQATEGSGQLPAASLCCMWAFYFIFSSSKTTVYIFPPIYNEDF